MMSKETPIVPAEQVASAAPMQGVVVGYVGTKLEMADGVVAGAGVGGPGTHTYPTEFCCWDGCNCFSKDCGLCCYASFCSLCLYAETMEKLEEPSFCCDVGFLPSFACVCPMGFVSWIIQVGMNLIGLGCCAPFVNITPCITCQTRVILGRKYGTSTTDCCCPCCAHYCCISCAQYQEAVYVKHVLKKDFDCCAYTTCCNGTAPGALPGLDPSYGRVGGAPNSPDAGSDDDAGAVAGATVLGTVTLQPGSA